MTNGGRFRNNNGFVTGCKPISISSAVSFFAVVTNVASHGKWSCVTQPRASIPATGDSQHSQKISAS